MSKEKDSRKKELGKSGEDIACAFLERKGYDVLQRNFRAGHNELDIICRDGDDLRFVEVKTRKLPMEGNPLDAVDRMKQKRMVAAARAYLSSEKRKKSMPSFDECHLDVITIVWDESGQWNDTEFIADAFSVFYT